MLLRYMGHDAHTLQLLLFLSTMVMKIVDLFIKLIKNTHV